MAKENKAVSMEEAVNQVDVPAVESSPANIVEPIQGVIHKSSAYNTIDEIPELFRPAVRAALKKVGFNGRRILTPDESGRLNLTDERLWVLDVLYNCGMFR